MIGFIIGLLIQSFKSKPAQKPRPTISPLAGTPIGRIRPLQACFAAKFVPMSMDNHREDFLLQMLSDEAGTKMLQLMWNRLAPAWVNADDVFPPVGLESVVYHKEPYLFFAITFPQPLVFGEAHFGIVAIGPCQGGRRADLKALLAAPYRYFVLLEGQGATQVVDLANERGEVLGTGPAPTLLQFTEWVNNFLFPRSTDFSVATDLPEMVEAMTRGRAQAPYMLERLASGEFRSDEFGVKVRVKGDVSNEYLWLENIECHDGHLFGVIGNDPVQVKELKEGDRWRGTVDDVVDWYVLRGKKLYGNHTLRAVLPTMPPNQAEAWRKALVIPPEVPLSDA